MDKVGKVVLERKPDAASARNSEGAFADVAGGRILYGYSHFTGSEDWAPSVIAISRSDDGGRTWRGEDVAVSMEDEGLMQDPKDPRNLMEVSFLRMNDGSLGLFYAVRNGIADTKMFLRRSPDEGRTWGPPVCCVDAFGYNVTCNDRAVRLASGRILIPTSYARIRRAGGAATAEELYGSLDGYLDCFFYVSDDDGRTWRQTSGRCKLDEPVSKTGLQEPVVVQLANGVLWMLARTDLGRQYESFSHDDGETWSSPQASVFTAPCSPLMIKRHPAGGELVAVWNPVPFSFSQAYPGQGQPQLFQKRSPLVIAKSADEGRTWSEARVLDGGGPDDTRMYEYPALHFAPDGAILVGYDGTGTDGGLSMFIRRVERSEL